MDSTSHIERRARLTYEWARLRRALLGFSPALIVVVMAVIFAKSPSSTLAFGVAMFAAGTILLWYGRELKRAVLPGLAAGLAPLVLVLCANHVGHACMGDSCTMLCLPACVAGGSVAGLGVASIGIRRRGGAGFWAAASMVALLTGAMGCACVGYSGLAGLALGFGAGVVPGAIRKYFAGHPA